MWGDGVGEGGLGHRQEQLYSEEHGGGAGAYPRPTRLLPASWPSDTSLDVKKNLGYEVQQIFHVACQSLSFLTCKMEILILPTSWDVVRRLRRLLQVKSWA